MTDIESKVKALTDDWYLVGVAQAQKSPRANELAETSGNLARRIMREIVEPMRDATIERLRAALAEEQARTICYTCGKELTTMANELKHADLKVLQYELEYDTEGERPITLSRVYGIDIERWAIRIGENQALGKKPDADGFYHFRIETMPSSRDDEYYENYRWLSADEALAFWQANRPRILATSAERRDAYWGKMKA